MSRGSDRPLVDHPLARDAVGTLRRLHAAAAARANRQHRRLADERDALPRGPLPVMARAAAATTEALHLLIALVALGDEEARRRLRPAAGSMAAARERSLWRDPACAGQAAGRAGEGER